MGVGVVRESGFVGRVGIGDLGRTGGVVKVFGYAAMMIRACVRSALWEITVCRDRTLVVCTAGCPSCKHWLHLGP